METIIQTKNLSHIYSPSTPFEQVALDNINLDIRKGEILGIIGHTGSGKSTFIQHLNGLLKPSSGEILFEGENIHKSKEFTRFVRFNVGLVFQYPEYQLFAETVFADVAFGLKNFSSSPLSAEDTKKAVREALETVGLNYDEIKERSPFELSGGQKRRVAIAGVIVTKPQILVLDEPAAGLDPLGKREIMQLLHKIHKEWCKTVIIVSHDMDEISENCTRAAVFSEGKVVAEDVPARLFSRSELLASLGLDVPFTAKITEALKEHGVRIDSDFTMEDFVKKTLYLAGLGKASAPSSEAEKGGDANA